jgi:RHS repeat-associated protein
MAQAGQPVHLKLGGAELSGDSGSVKENTNLTLTALRSVDMPVMGSGMVNVTAGAKGYRFLPHGSLFAKDLALKINYDTTLLPAGYRASDIRTYYFDDNRQSWVMLPPDTIHAGKGMIASLTNHFTDFVNAILKTPESPQTQAYTPTSIKDIKAANPFEGLNLIQAPKANNMGTANLSFPIEVPAGRQGLQPNLAIQYNSGGGNGWLGVGWDLSIPAFTVETRWGVPRYDAVKETESYLMAGEQLTPTAHRDSTGNRSTTQTTKQFYPRVEGAFNRIIRHGTTPQTYWWEVTDRNGIKYYYGKYSSDAAVNQTLVLTDGAGNIAHWALAETRDLDGNYVKYIYDIVHNVGIQGGTVDGKQIYIKQIVYTGHGTTDGKYKVDFVRKLNDNTEIRNDAIISGRYGFKEVTANLLKEVKVSYNDTNIRSYLIIYKYGAYDKNLICNIIEGPGSSDAYQEAILHGASKWCEQSNPVKMLRNGLQIHRFNYFKEDAGGFTDEVSISIPYDEVKGSSLSGFGNDASALSVSSSTSWSYGGGLNIGLGTDFTKKSNTIGGSFNRTVSDGEIFLALTDLNGDGYPDKVFKKDDFVYYRKMINNNGTLYFDPNRVYIPGLSYLGSENSSSNAWGLDGHVGFGESMSANGGYSGPRTDTYIPRYFVDINGDGLPDFINDNYFVINKLNANGNPYFEEPTSEKIMIGDDSCSFTVHSGEVNDSVIMFSHDKFGNLVEDSINHESVRLWIAPYTGTVHVNAPIQLIKDNSYSRQQSHNVDGVQYTIQHNNDDELIRDTISASNYNTKANTINSLGVAKGDRIYFRLQSNYSRLWDDVIWNPEIFYVNTDTSLTDADGKKINKFKASGDFLLNAKQRLQAPFPGQLHIEGTLSAPPLSDILKFKILKGNNVVYQVDFPDNSTINHVVDIVIPVAEDDDLDFIASTSTNVNFNVINCNITAHYNSVPSSLSMDASLLNNFKLKPVLKFNLFQDHRIKTVPYTLSQTGTIDITPTITWQTGSTVNGNVTLAVKKGHQLVALQNLTVVNNAFSGSTTFQITNSSSATYYFEYYTENASIAENATAAGIIIGSNTIDAGLHSTMPDTLWKFGNLYQGWGQFVYNHNPNDKIIESLLYLNDAYQNVSALSNFSTGTNFSSYQSSQNYLSGANFNIANPKSDIFGMMYPDLDSLVWRDASNITLVGSMKMSNAFKRHSFSETVYDSPIPVALPGQKVRVVRKEIIQRSNCWSGAVGPTHVTAGASHTDGDSETFADFMDINGDRFPDIVGPERIQFTDSKGSLESCVTNINVPLISKNSFSSTGQSLGGRFPIIKAKPANPAINRQLSVISDANIGGSITDSDDDTQFTYLDVNGDGLPDKVFQDGSIYKVSLNLGYKFTTKETWNLLNLKEGTSRSTGINVGAAAQYTFLQGLAEKFSKFEMSWAAGVSFNESNTYSKIYNQDINGDGLVDVVKYDNNETMVAFNTGNGFSQFATWSPEDTRQYSYSFNESGSASFTVGFAVPLPIIGGIKVCVNPSGSVSGSVFKDKNQMVDVNADGYPDIVSSESDDEFKVRFNKLGRINLLQTVENIAGSTFELDYTLTDNTQKMPQRSWVLSSVLTYDGHPGDGADYSYVTFEYKNGYYSRSERQSFGFDTVITKQYDTQTDPAKPKEGTCYRMITESYHNNSFLFKGIKRYELLTDCSNTKYVETVYTYKAKRISTGEEVPENMMNCYCDYYPAISTVDKYFYEGQANYEIHTRKQYKHGPYGNVTEYTNFGDLNDPDDDLTGYIDYSPVIANNQLGLVYDIEVKHNTTLLRSRKAYYNQNNGRMYNLVLQNTSFYASMFFYYDSYGNIQTVYGPRNASDQHNILTYEYDPAVHTYPVKVRDTLGYESTSEIDYRFGKPVKTIDVSGNEMRYQYDANGKIRDIIAPYEIENNIPYTLHFDYWNDYDISLGNTDTVLWARTRHYDPLNPGNEITTVLFADGLGRVLQTKKKTTVYDLGNNTNTDMLSVSGAVVLDAFGRAVTGYYPVTEGLDADSIFNYTVDNVNPTTTTYDLLDRKLLLTMPDQTTTTYAYDFGNDRDNVLRFKTTLTDANSNAVNTYIDARGLQTTVSASLGAITSFTYNALGELIKSTDPEGNETTHTYDLLGQHISRVHPDAGTTLCEYDNAGNLVQMQTQNLSGSNEFIQYRYYYNRIDKILYPDNPENNVFYEYYPAGSGNGSGQVYKQQDASGVQLFQYGKLGEVIKNTRTYIMPGGDPYTFAMEWKYDSWNRLQYIMYPDREKVDYHYNNGGSLAQMTGNKYGFTDTIVYIDKMGYDKFDKRLYLKYGNQTYSIYDYNPVTLQLSNLASYNSLGEKMQDINYTYDNVSNITQIQNGANPLSNGMGGKTTYTYGYDELYRLTSATGGWDNNGVRSFSLGMEYSFSGNITRKTQYAETLINGTANTLNYDNYYSYTGTQPHALTEINSGQISTGWDANGNLLHYRDVNNNINRRHCWDEENRLSAVNDYRTAASYIYDAADERVWKLTGDAMEMQINGGQTINFTELNNHTLYTSPYMVMNDQGYTKHYYIEGERICSKLGGGLDKAIVPVDSSVVPIDGPYSHRAGELQDMVLRSMGCVNINSEYTTIDSHFSILDYLKTVNNPENDLYFYHSDHLGSSSFITDADGIVSQHLQYLPYGELFAEQRDNTARYYTPYKFSGKEKDEETGYSYFGARYYMPELSIWSAVDPMADKYPYISPYNYCELNPIMLVDPDGNSAETRYVDEQGNVIHHSNDKLEDAVVVISNENLAKFKADLDKSIKNKTADNDNVNKEYRSKYGNHSTYMVGQFWSFYDENSKDYINTHGGVKGLAREHGFFLYDNNGVIERGPENIAGEEDQIPVAKQIPKRKNPVSFAHTHPNAGKSNGYGQYTENPSPQDMAVNKQQQKYYDVVISKGKIYLINRIGHMPIIINRSSFKK